MSTEPDPTASPVPDAPKAAAPAAKPRKSRKAATSRKTSAARNARKPARSGCCGVIGGAVLLIVVGLVALVLRDEFFPPDRPTPVPASVASGARSGQASFPGDASVEAGADEDGDQAAAIEPITLRGTVRLPAASALDPADLTIVANDGQARPSADGAFSVAALRGPDATTLALALNASGNPVLLRATRGAATLASGELSARSTASALALFDLAVLDLPPSLQDQAWRGLASAAGFADLLSAVEDAIVADPERPLDDAAHPEVYEAAARVTAGVLGTLEGAAYAPSPRGRWLEVPRAYAAAPAPAGAAGYVFVADDPEHRLPEVVLNNRTFAYYQATIKGGKLAGSIANPVLVRRSKPFNVVRFQLPLPLVGTETTVRPGDGNLEFAFVKDTQLSAFDLILTVTSNLLGIPATQAGGIQEQLRIFMGASKELQSAIRDLAALSKMHGLSPEDAAKEVAKFVGVHGTTIALTALAMHGHAAADQAGQLYVGKVAQLIGRKAFFGITAGYAGVDITGMAWSLANAPDSYTEAGVQENGVYPAITLAVEPATIEDARPGQAYAFTAKAAHIPDTVAQVRFFWDYTDGESDEIESLPEAGMAMVSVKHAFDRDREVRAYLIDPSTGARLASAVAMVTVGAEPTPTRPVNAGPTSTSPAEDPLNGTWNVSMACTDSSDKEEIGQTMTGSMRISAANGAVQIEIEDGEGGWVSLGASSSFTQSRDHYSFEIVAAWHDSGGLMSEHQAYELNRQGPNRLSGTMHDEMGQNRDGGYDILSEADYNVTLTR